MCGVVGYSLAAGGEAITPDLDGAVEALEHRGPDGHGTFRDTSFGVGLGHTRLAIIDLSENGAQPMLSECKRYVLSFNGEIYNFEHLREELVEAGFSFKGTSDSEVLLTLLIYKGSDALSLINGIFAFAFYDKETGRLMLARDAYGVKQLYFRCDDSGVAFASEIRALHRLWPSISSLDHSVIANYLSYIWNPTATTVEKGVYTLRPGELMVIEQGAVRDEKRWFQPPILKPKIRYASKVKHTADTVNYMRAAVHRQMVSDVPVGAFLSGGLDSSAVVAFAKELNPNTKCYTIAVDGGVESGASDDLPYAKNVADHLNLPLEIVSVAPTDMAQDLSKMIVHLEEPIADPACLNVYYISKLAREQGIKVLLSGCGGDDLFTGYRRHQAVAMDQWAKILPRVLRGALSSAGASLSHRSSTARRVSKFLNGFDAGSTERLVNYFIWTGRNDLLSLFRPEIAAKLCKVDLAAEMKNYLKLVDESSHPINQILALEQRYFLAEHNLLYTDKMSMATSVEVRVPFLDLELAEFASQLPVSVKQRGRHGKWILKKAMESFLPKGVIYRPKAGFGAPLRRWLKEDLAEFKTQLLSSESLLNRGLFDVHSVRKMIAEDESGRRDFSYTIFSLMCIEIWCREFVDKPASLSIVS